MEDETTRTSTRFAELTTDPETRWQQLAQDLGANFSLYPEWSAITAASHNIKNSSALVELQRADRTIAVYPINVSSGRIFGLSSRTLGLISNSVSYHNQILSRQNPRDAIDGIVDEGIRGNVDVVHLSGIPDDTELGEYLRQATTDRRYRTHSILGDSSPYLPLATTWQDLLASKAKKFRYKLRKRAEALETSDALRLKALEIKSLWQRRHLTTARLTLIYTIQNVRLSGFRRRCAVRRRDKTSTIREIQAH